MQKRLITAPRYGYDNRSPLIFLAGPIQGTKDWQRMAANYLLTRNEEIMVANPRREISTGGQDFDALQYQEQVNWETHHLRAAGKNGVILFWLANESDHYCSRAYAQTTRFELGEWYVRHQVEGSRIVVGIGSMFTGSRYIRLRLSQDCPDVPVHSSLEETCDAALRLLPE